MTISNQPELNIGIVGHIDHGKTTLLYKLTGIWADKHSEELKRGITIKLGYADVIIKKCEKCGTFTTKATCECGGKAVDVKWVSFIDAPGHEMLMATMLGGAAVIDAALLVIAANEPFPQPQTKEHLLALEAKGIKQVIIAQNKLDLVTREQALKQYNEIKEFVKNTIAKDAVIVPICAQQEINISALLEAITKLKVPERDTESKPLFLIARSFDINRPGTPIQELSGGILGGCLKKGRLKIGDKIEIKPGHSEEKARAARVQNDQNKDYRIDGWLISKTRSYSFRLACNTNLFRSSAHKGRCTCRMYCRSRRHTARACLQNQVKIEHFQGDCRG